MDKPGSKVIPKPFDLTSFADLLPSRRPIIGEEPANYGAFHDGLIASLAPLSPYECIIAENLISIEWEILQRRQMRDHALRKDIEQMIRKAVSNRQIEQSGTTLGAAKDPDDISDLIIKRANSENPEIREQAYQQVANLGFQPIDLLDEAYSKYIELRNHARQHDERLRDLERRRREVKKDYDALQRARPTDGEIVDG